MGARCDFSTRCSPRGRPGVRSASLVGTLRPGRKGLNRAVAVPLSRSRSEAKAFPWRAPSLIAASGRRTRRRGSQRDRSLTVSPDPEAFSAATLEIAWVCTSRERTVERLSLAPISRAAGMDEFPPLRMRPAAWSRGERRRAGATQPTQNTENNLLRIDT